MGLSLWWKLTLTLTLLTKRRGRRRGRRREGDINFPTTSIDRCPLLPFLEMHFISPPSISSRQPRLTVLDNCSPTPWGSHIKSSFFLTSHSITILTYRPFFFYQSILPWDQDQDQDISALGHRLVSRLSFFYAALHQTNKALACC